MAIAGKKRKEALLALFEVYRVYAKKHPDLYRLSMVFPSKLSKSYKTVFFGLRDLYGNIVRDNYTLSENEVRSAARAIRSMIHGFISIELMGGWSSIVDIKTSFYQSVDFLIQGIELAESKSKKN